MSRQGVHADFNGNDCKTILKCALQLRADLITQAQHIATILAAFNRLVDSCFGQQLLEDWKDRHAQFFWLMEVHQIGLTIKLHCLKFHVPEFIDQHNQALGVYSEQASESIHHEWTQFYQRYAGASNDTKAYTFLRALVKFNYLNM